MLITAGQDAGAATQFNNRFSPNPYQILGIRLDAPSIDAVALCLGDAPIPTSTPASREQGASAPTDDQTGDTETPLATAIISARSAAGEIDERAARKRLVQALSNTASPRTMACGWLELARLELRSNRVPEARATAGRALRALEKSGGPNPLRRAVRFYRAESLAGTGDMDAALAIHRELSTGEDSIARSSQLRLADAKQSESPSRAQRLALESLIVHNAGTSSAAWGPRLSEFAIAEGDFDGALDWLDLAAKSDLPMTETLRDAIAFRRADVLHAKNDKKAARAILQELAESGRTHAIQRFALVRKLDLGGNRDEAALRRLERAFENGDRRLAAYAGGVLARRLLAAERHEQALEILVELVHRRADTPENLIDPTLFDASLDALSTTGSCETWITQVGGLRDLLLRYAATPGPFLRLGDCYQEVGMHAAALETFRGIAKSFGPTVVGALTLRSAQSEYRLGQLATARAAAHANVQAAVEPLDAWRLLLARIQLSDGEPTEAKRTLRPVLEHIAKVAAPSHRPDDRAAILLGARAAASSGADVEDRALLRRALARAPTESDPTNGLTEASLIIADLHRQAGELDTARELYTPALTRLDHGVLRSRSAYWLGVLASHSDEARALWSRVANDDDPWARLAANEIALTDGRAAIGEPLAVPATRRPQPRRGEF